MKKWLELDLSRKELLRFSAVIVIVVGIVSTLIFAANININAGERIEFGQGVIQTVTCDTRVEVSLTSKIDTTTGEFALETLSLSDLSTQLRDRTIVIDLVGSDGSALNSAMSFAVGTDGLTYTSSRAHVDILDAFTPGSGPNAEMGSSKITFTSLLTEEIAPIPTENIKKVTLQTSGNGTCTVPTNIQAVKLYIDAPYVQGSYVPELYPSTASVDNYNSGTQNNQNCSALAQNTGTYTGDCEIILRTNGNPYQYGGATTTGSTPTTGGSASSQSPSAAVFTSNGLTITFATRKNYIGFWWSAGSYGNSIKFYRGSTLVATMTGDEVYTLLSGNAGLTALNGSTQYTKSNYYGHPLNASTLDPGEPFVYFHAYAVNGFNFDKVVLNTTGNGLEYDNLTVANLGGSQLTPKNTLVFVTSYSFTG